MKLEWSLKRHKNQSKNIIVILKNTQHNLQIQTRRPLASKFTGIIQAICVPQIHVYQLSNWCGSSCIQKSFETNYLPCKWIIFLMHRVMFCSALYYDLIIWLMLLWAVSTDLCLSRRRHLPGNHQILLFQLQPPFFFFFFLNFLSMLQTVTWVVPQFHKKGRLQ